MVEKRRNKKCRKCNDKTNCSKCERIEKLIICTLELPVYIPKSYHMDHNLNKSCHIKYFFMDMIEDDEEEKVEKWKNKHRVYGVGFLL